MSVHAVRDHAVLAKLREEWAQLHRDVAPGSPFEHPAWAETWSRHFVPPGDLECVAIRDGGSDGPLIGFAPLYRRRLSGAGLTATSIQPLGTGRGQSLTEVVQVLSRPERTQDVLRAVAGHLEQLPDWDWLQLSLGPEQGWLVPQWFEDRARSSILHRGVRPCVVVCPLPGTEEELLRGLKRNVRESVRRATNRGRRAGISTLCEATPEAVEGVLGSLMALHRRRSQMLGKVAHPDALARDEVRPFLVEAVQSMAVHGLARVHTARHGGRDIAGQLVLSDGHTDYMSLSGLDPEYWDYSLNTLLVFEGMRMAVRSGRAAVNLSTGPDVAKLRWSSQIKSYNDFVVVRSERRSHWLFEAYSHATLALTLRQERRRHRIHGDDLRPAVFRQRSGPAAGRPAPVESSPTQSPE